MIDGNVNHSIQQNLEQNLSDLFYYDGVRLSVILDIPSISLRSLSDLSSSAYLLFFLSFAFDFETYFCFF